MKTVLLAANSAGTRPLLKVFDVSGVLDNMCCYLQVLDMLREPLNLRLAAIQDSQGSHEQFFFVCEGPRVRFFLHPGGLHNHHMLVDDSSKRASS